MKQALLLTAILSSAPVLAHNDNHISFSSDNCQIEFQNNVAITPTEVAITTANSQRLTIDADGQTFINGQQVDVSEQQQRALTHYADTLRVELPKVAEMATDAVDLAEVALNEVAIAFDLNGLEKLSSMLEEINQEVHATFYQQGSFVMGEQAFNDFSENFENQFEERIEKAVKSAMFESIGSLLVTIGSEMNNSNGNMQAFEQRMENMGKQIEEKVSAQAEHLEQQAESMCDNFAHIAEQETALSHAIPALSSYSLMRVTAQ
ncbi:hypothetical protein A7985_20740 [Pseudoalteromonas luteoviolacea]|uniref:DUF2884 family protein n=1 Tax=Pseudoalteromonas luteoviolacea TaxID=43657 RepID=A0A1C0TL08_9GAMM|nr:DUF2884 family protein [Pseudoalteromonas luteoviolacea]OCQ19169.1 hypothetical protein A7985_20740 [Pseudoalteromonas luteoviolacea]